MQLSMFTAAIAAAQTSATNPVLIPVQYIGPRQEFISYDWLEAVMNDPRFEGDLQLTPGDIRVDLSADQFGPDESLMGMKRKRKGAKQ